MYSAIRIEKPSAFIYFIVFLIFFQLMGCAGFGRIVLMENRILLSDEQTKQGTFSDGGNSLNYSYTLDGNDMAIKGEVFTRGSISSLRAQILLLDEKGAIVESKNIYISGYRNFRKGNKSFSRKISLPEDITGFSFDFYVEYQMRR